MQLLAKFPFFKKLSQVWHIDKSGNFKSIIGLFLDQLLLPYKFYGRDMIIRNILSYFRQLWGVKCFLRYVCTSSGKHFILIPKLISPYFPILLTVPPVYVPHSPPLNDILTTSLDGSFSHAGFWRELVYFQQNQVWEEYWYGFKFNLNPKGR